MAKVSDVSRNQSWSFGLQKPKHGRFAFGGRCRPFDGCYAGVKAVVIQHRI